MDRKEVRLAVNIPIDLYEWLVNQDEAVSYICKYLIRLYVDGFIGEETLRKQSMSTVIEKKTLNIRCAPELITAFKERKLHNVSHTVGLLVNYYKNLKDNKTQPAL
jgi:hypothetical protein